MASDIDRYLRQRAPSPFWQYIRSVPEPVKFLDPRYPKARKSLKTKSLAEAREKRDMLEIADNDLWAALEAGVTHSTAMERYDASLKAEKAMKLPQASVLELANKLIDDLAAGKSLMETEFHIRLTKAAETLGDDSWKHQNSAVKKAKAGNYDFTKEEWHALNNPDEDTGTLKTKQGEVFAAAAMGGLLVPPLHVSGLAEYYTNEIARDAWRNKSEKQQRDWKKWPIVSARRFIDIVGDREVLAITRAEALQLRSFWNDKLDTLNPKTGRPFSHKSASREIGTLRVMITKLAEMQGLDDYRNPFDRITFTGENIVRQPIPIDWIKEKLLQGDGLAGLNDQARGIQLAMIETGCRLSEIANLRPENIVLQAEIPYISIEPVLFGKNKVAVKTKASIRKIPLVGVSLAVFQKHRNGFPKYFDRGDVLSATLGKYTLQNGLRASDGQTAAHSMRHSFKDRCRAAGIA